jgi:hypothetical protein
MIVVVGGDPSEINLQHFRGEDRFVAPRHPRGRPCGKHASKRTFVDALDAEQGERINRQRWCFPIALRQHSRRRQLHQQRHRHAWHAPPEVGHLNTCLIRSRTTKHTSNAASTVT